MASEKLLSAVVANDADIDYAVMAAGNSGAEENPDQLHAHELSGCLLWIGLPGSHALALA